MSYLDRILHRTFLNAVEKLGLSVYFLKHIGKNKIFEK